MSAPCPQIQWRRRCTVLCFCGGGRIMPGSRGRKPKPQSQQSRPLPPAPSPPQGHSRPLLHKLGLVWTAVVSIGSTGGLLSLVERGRDFLVLETRPKIERPGLATDPFVLPFSIRNVSSFFDMRDVQWICNMPNLTAGTNSFTN